MSAESMEMIVSEPVDGGFLAIDGLDEYIPFSHSSISRGYNSSATVSIDIPKPIKPEAEKAIREWMTSSGRIEKISLMNKNEKLLNELFFPSSCTMNPDGDHIQLIITSRIQ